MVFDIFVLPISDNIQTSGDRVFLVSGQGERGEESEKGGQGEQREQGEHGEQGEQSEQTGHRHLLSTGLRT